MVTSTVNAAVTWDRISVSQYLLESLGSGDLRRSLSLSFFLSRLLLLLLLLLLLRLRSRRRFLSLSRS